MDSPEEAIGRVLAGDREAYSTLVEAYQEMLLAYAAFRVPDAALVDEVVQQTFIRAYEQLREYRPERDFGVWLRTICRFMILAELKRAVRDRENRAGYRDHLELRLLEEALDRGAAKPNEDLLARLKGCLAKLGESSRTLVELRYQQLLDLKEIARRTGQSLTGVATTLFRVRGALRKCLIEESGA